MVNINLGETVNYQRKTIVELQAKLTHYEAVVEAAKNWEKSRDAYDPNGEHLMPSEIELMVALTALEAQE